MSEEANKEAAENGNENENGNNANASGWKPKMRPRRENENMRYALYLDINGKRAYYRETDSYVCAFTICANVKDAYLFDSRKDCAARRRKLKAQCEILFEPTYVYVAGEDVGLNDSEKFSTDWCLS